MKLTIELFTGPADDRRDPTSADMQYMIEMLENIAAYAKHRGDVEGWRTAGGSIYVFRQIKQALEEKTKLS